MEPQKKCALDLYNISVVDLMPKLMENQPFKLTQDRNGKDYFLCLCNQDGDSYRSPWSNTYDPPLEDGSMPSEELRKLEVEANYAFDKYRQIYYEGGVSSVYLWEKVHGFAGVILLRKAVDGSQKSKGCWDSIHIVEVVEKTFGRSANYKLISTAILGLQANKERSGTMNLSGSLTRKVEQDCSVSELTPHIANIGRMVEDMENKIRNELNRIYFGKTRAIVNGLRSVVPTDVQRRTAALQHDLAVALQRRQVARTVYDIYSFDRT